MPSVLDLAVVDEGTKVLIAYHLYKRCFSIRDADTRRVIGYTDRIVVRDVRFLVSPAGRERVLRERRKNVHAYVCGRFEYELQQARFRSEALREAYYNPYLAAAFMDRATVSPIRNTDIAICERGKVYYCMSDPLGC